MYLISIGLGNVFAKDASLLLDSPIHNTGKAPCFHWCIDTGPEMRGRVSEAWV